ncbi:MAG: penicillin acylase family protein [Chloroflexi bacterium]|nr:penicillin acylase family protein [Chloroflexota bacterium]
MKPEECLAVHSGKTRVDGLDGPVTIVRDRWGIPHIRAGTTHDAFFAQGFCMAQDRAWQIELIRQMAHGRAAGLLNRGLLGLDIQNRKLGFGRLAETEWAHQGAEARTVLEAYAAGVNAAIRTQPVPFEFRAIGHEMQPWSPVDSLAIIKLVNSGQQWASKLKFGQVAATLGAEALNALIPEVPPGAALIVPSGARWAGEQHPFREDIARAMGEPDGPVASGGGSNCWVIHGSRTESGAPLVAGDPHLQMTLPGQWYVVHMECPEFTAAGPCNPGYPGPVFYGHNTKVAWTMTHAQGDRWDLYRERIRPGADGPEALFRGEWAPLTRLDERFEVRGGEAVSAPVWLTRHGPVIFGDPTCDEEVIAARWGLAEPAHDTEAMLAMLRASSAAEARAALRRYDSVSGNYCFADTKGDIGYQYTGRIPKRPAWLVPVPGWTGEHEWDGSVAKADLPAEDNPANGYLLTANNRTTKPDYPHYLTYMATRFRADRLRELIEATGRFSVDDMRRLQGDQVSIQAREQAAKVAAVPATTERGRGLQSLLAGWDGHLAVESAAALALEVVSEALLTRTVRAYFGKVPQAPETTLLEERRMLHAGLTSGSSLLLVEDATWDEAVDRALDEAAGTLEALYGKDPAGWRWGAAHAIHWRHNLGRDEALAPILNLAPMPVGGDGNSPFNTYAERDGKVAVGVSYRQVFDLADLNAARICVPPGNSGQPGSPHYADNVDRWRQVEYHPLFINWDDIEANAEARLVLSASPR